MEEHSEVIAGAEWGSPDSDGHIPIYLGDLDILGVASVTS